MKKFAVIGLGSFGYHVACALYADGNEVIAIDADRDQVQAMDAFCTQALVLDATEREALEPLELETMDAVVVSTGSNISSSILICLHLYELGVARILAKVQDEDHGKILRKVGASEVIYPERDIAVRVARGLAHPNFLDFIPIGGDFDLVQLGAPPEFQGKNLKELDLRARYNVHIIAIKQQEVEDFLLAPPADYVIRGTDILVILGKADDIKRIRALK
jgi:trk system potassium uptake protein